jgi:hypothetical protein
MDTLRRLIAEASVLAGGAHPCMVLGHVWVHIGGRNCGCDGGGCSVPVYECSACGDCDYGDNTEMGEIIEACARRYADA